ncbi:hypothetical protein SB725_30390, partial [Pseudomonas sp. SIMBA_041]|uniref:hypothetical protein n=1 Tax=Pseudomonas sp. SIMBA_041 TaxID=3085782 RepID=UPI003979E5B0
RERHVVTHCVCDCPHFRCCFAVRENQVAGQRVTRADPGLPPGKPENLLRYWRDVRGVNPLDLSLEAGVS